MNATRHHDNMAGINKAGSTDDTAVDDSLSRTARQLHAAAVANVSASIQAQLHQRRRRALSDGGVAVHRGSTRPLAWTGAFAVLALAVALPMAMWPAQEPVTSRVADTVATTASTTASTPPGNRDIPIATLEEDPEMYVWLASNDAIALASE